MSEEKKNPHVGHRARMKAKYRRHGAEIFDDHELLEIVLYYCVPHKDTNPLAHRLIDTFGSLDGVFNARVEDLMQVEGMGESTALYLHLYNDVHSAILKSKARVRTYASSVSDMAQILWPHFENARNELVYVLCLDNKRKVLGCGKVFEGSFNTALVSTKKVLEIAMKFNSSAVVICHNHPIGIAVPSDVDRATTARLSSILASVGIMLADHLIFDETGDYVSFRESGYLSEETENSATMIVGDGSAENGEDVFIKL